MIRLFILSCGLFLCWSYGATANAGDIYRYVDERGVVHFTDTPTSSRYRAWWLDPRVDDIIAHYAEQYGLEAALIKAVVRAESDFDPRAESHKGAKGLMQLIPETAADLDVRDPFDPTESIRGGSRYLKQMLVRFDGRLDLALAAYNAGPTAVQRYGGVPPYQETERYIRKVKRFLSQYRQEAKTNS